MIALAGAARKWDCLWASSYHVQNEKIDIPPGRVGIVVRSKTWFGKTFLKALSDFAHKIRSSEIEIPWALWGHSGGGIWWM